MPASVQIQAGTAYEGPFKDVAVNSEEPLVFETDKYTVRVVVRIRDYHKDGKAIPSKYFDAKGRGSDQFSIQFVVDFKEDVNGDKLLWGNDFDQPIRDILPWGFSGAFKVFKWSVDPSVDGDVYADKPYLYGPALTSVNWIAKQDNDELAVPVVEALDPAHDVSATTRRREFLDQGKRKAFTFAKGSTYDFDFCTPYLSMGEKLAIKLPGFTFDVGKYAGLAQLRYVLKNGEDLVFALVFSAAKPEGGEADGDTATAEKTDAAEAGKAESTPDKGKGDSSPAKAKEDAAEAKVDTAADSGKNDKAGKADISDKAA